MVVEGSNDRRGLLGQLVRFAAVGLLGAAVDYSVYQLSLHLGLWVTAARTLSFICGTATVYAINRRWTFGVEGGARRAAGFALLYGTTFFVIIGVNAAALAVAAGELVADHPGLGAVPGLRDGGQLRDAPPGRLPPVTTRTAGHRT